MGYLMKNNKPIIVDGTLIEVPTQQTKTVELSMASGNQTISPDSGKVLSEVIVTKPSTLISANIKKDVVIGGVTGALEEGVESETWVINESPDTSSMRVNVSIPFVSKETSYSRIIVFTQINYDNSRAYDWANEIWIDPAYRKITFLEPPTGNLLTWLQANAVKQPSDQAIQTDKSLTVTSNGTVSVLPDEPYDAMSKVDLTVNVAESETSTVTIVKNDWWDTSSSHFTIALAFISPDGTLATQTISAKALPDSDVVFYVRKNTIVACYYRNGAILSFTQDIEGGELLDKYPLSIYGGFFVTGDSCIITPISDE